MDDLISRQAAIDAVKEYFKFSPRRMRIGDEVYVHGYVDEIRPGTVIVRNDGGYFGTIPEEISMVTSLFDGIKALPSAEPERKKGFWYALEKGDKGYSASDFKCSVCGEPNHTWLTKPNYCPNCGAKMEG